MVTPANPEDVGVVTPPVCDHNGRASGRLTLEEASVRCEIVCECGQMLAFLGHEDYNLGRRTAPRRRPTGARLRRSTTQAARAFGRSIGRKRGAPVPVERSSGLIPERVPDQ
ncbi:MAG TPA: hypothetical protein VGW98_02285 [Solirubrobacteraceae bacterium]|jgi:hypothetical protein|nr:hypothetical protein [Solirubrobacteraceae bacterium]